MRQGWRLAADFSQAVRPHLPRSVGAQGRLCAPSSALVGAAVKCSRKVWLYPCPSLKGVTDGLPFSPHMCEHRSSECAAVSAAGGCGRLLRPVHGTVDGDADAGAGRSGSGGCRTRAGVSSRGGGGVPAAAAGAAAAAAAGRDSGEQVGRSGRIL